MGKLKYGTGDDWNQHRSDVNNLTRYIESRWKLDLTWQIVDLKKSSVDDLVQSPVLYFCGSGARCRPPRTNSARSLSNCGITSIAAGSSLPRPIAAPRASTPASALLRLMFPEPEYRLHLLPPEHPIWFAEADVKPEGLRPLLGIDYGCRTSVVYAPLDPKDRPRPSLSCLWELSRSGRRTEV